MIFDFFKPILDLISEFSQIIIAVCALFGIFLTYCTLHEMQTQRIKSCQPHIIIQSTDISAYTKPNEMFVFWKNKQEIANKDLDHPNGPILNFVNIGLGPAKDISIEWSFNMKPIIDKINCKFLGNIHIKIDNNSKLIIEVKKTVDQKPFHIKQNSITISDELMQYQSYLKGSGDGVNCNLSIPLIYSTIIPYYHRTGESTDFTPFELIENDNQGLVNPICLTIHLKYKDIEDIEYKSDIPIYMKAYYSETISETFEMRYFIYSGPIMKKKISPRLNYLKNIILWNNCIF